MIFDIDTVRETLTSFAAALSAAFIGRLAKHVLLVQKGLRQFWGVHLLLELPVAIFMGFVGSGLADWIHLTGRSTIGLVAAVSYLGPAAIEHCYAKYMWNNKTE
ncbi:MAG: hypothetical protein EYC62_02470 [Alphaproteobacteria bacterium]|nr:MAG: hypothetical protein EYC62_02470 [Alphaproteobacteria bacterium]